MKRGGGWLLHFWWFLSLLLLFSRFNQGFSHYIWCFTPPITLKTRVTKLIFPWFLDACLYSSSKISASSTFTARAVFANSSRAKRIKASLGLFWLAKSLTFSFIASISFSVACVVVAVGSVTFALFGSGAASSRSSSTTSSCSYPQNKVPQLNLFLRLVIKQNYNNVNINIFTFYFLKSFPVAPNIKTMNQKSFPEY